MSEQIVSLCAQCPGSHVGSDKQHCDEEPLTECLRFKLVSNGLADKHACKCRDDCSGRAQCETLGKTACGTKAGGKRHRGYRERQTQRLNEFVLRETKGAQVRNGWHGEHTGSACEHAGDAANDRPKYGLLPRGHREARQEQPGQRVDRQHRAQRKRGPTRTVARKETDADRRAHAHEEHHDKETTCNATERGACCELPDIGDY